MQLSARDLSLPLQEASSLLEPSPSLPSLPKNPELSVTSPVPGFIVTRAPEGGVQGMSAWGTWAASPQGVGRVESGAIQMLATACRALPTRSRTARRGRIGGGLQRRRRTGGGFDVGDRRGRLQGVRAGWREAGAGPLRRRRGWRARIPPGCRWRRGRGRSADRRSDELAGRRRGCAPGPVVGRLRR